LRTGNDREGEQSRRELLGICDHNVKDIFGLASLFRAFTSIAASPLEARQRFRCDAEQLALCWRRGLRRASSCETEGPDLDAGFSRHKTGNQEETAALLLDRAALRHPYACLRLGLDLRARRRYEEGRAKLLELREWSGEAGREACPPRIRALALRALSIDAEKQLRPEEALAYIGEALAPAPCPAAEPSFTPAAALPPALRADLERRRERLLKKTGQGGMFGG
jgi:hypothetical protein